MEFSIEKCGMNRGKRLLNQEIIRTLGEKENYKYLGLLKVDINKQAELKEKIKNI